ncbi:DUF397 domain-containing protein [Streptomyces sp. SID4985]|uniref:DUF397 domain-containing protein n=1 Tax=Streptomyces sp. SID4985 TaxID=2690292 RepID=UPI0013698401|nr:DUF397 domain-containing protein [Streptomyces sp. SID4985]MYQ48618.1 DUF397 domain-containing protein [Streptomyces sp. SID4985]
MNEAGSSTTTWVKSSHSGTEGGECVEIAAAPAAVHVRDSKATTGPILTISPSAWTEFVGLASKEC